MLTDMRIKEQVELIRGFSLNEIWFTSDMHFFHNRVIEYCLDLLLVLKK